MLSFPFEKIAHKRSFRVPSLKKKRTEDTKNDLPKNVEHSVALLQIQINAADVTVSSISITMSFYKSNLFLAAMLNLVKY